jgi:hypothetical protein
MGRSFLAFDEPTRCECVAGCDAIADIPQLSAIAYEPINVVRRSTIRNAMQFNDPRERVYTDGHIEVALGH